MVGQKGLGDVINLCLMVQSPFGTLCKKAAEISNQNNLLKKYFRY